MGVEGPEGDDPAARFARSRIDRRSRDLRTYGPPRRHTQLIWLAIALAGAVIFVVLILAVLEKSKGTAVASAPDSGPPRSADA